MPLIIRKAQIKDLKKTFEWANYKEVIKNSLKRTKKVKFNEHNSWFRNYINSKNNFIFIAYFRRKKIGMVRLDGMKNEFFVGYVIDRKYRNKKFSSQMLNKVIKKIQRKGHKLVLNALVIKSNLPSIKMIKKVGFKKSYTRQNKNIILYKLIKNNV